jgi:hypothetical protein
MGDDAGFCGWGGGDVLYCKLGAKARKVEQYLQWRL